MAIHVTVWNEYLHEKQFPEIASIRRASTGASPTFCRKRA